MPEESGNGVLGLGIIDEARCGEEAGRYVPESQSRSARETDPASLRPATKSDPLDQFLLVSESQRREIEKS